MRARRTCFLHDEDCKSPSLIKKKKRVVRGSIWPRGKEFQLSTAIPACLCSRLGSTNGYSLNVYNWPFIYCCMCFTVSETLCTRGSHCSHGWMVNYFITSVTCRSMKFSVGSKNLKKDCHADNVHLREHNANFLVQLWRFGFFWTAESQGDLKKWPEVWGARGELVKLAYFPHYKCIQKPWFFFLI